MPDGRVLLQSSGQHPWVASPTWTRYDELPNCRCQGWEITVGRSSIFETTDVGTATVHFQDRIAKLDVEATIGRGILLQIKDPVTGIWQPSFRGVIEEATHDVYPLSAGLVSTVQLRCVDMFAWLGRAQMVLGSHGQFTTVKELQGSVVWGLARVDDRIRSLLAAPNGVGIPAEMAVVFTGNVHLWDIAYDEGESFLTGLRDAADAEFPGVANIYVDRQGRFCFHGRESRFDPDGTEAAQANWDFNRWHLGDGSAVAAGAAQLRSLSFSRLSSLIYNIASAWPRFVPSNKPGWKRQFPEKQKRLQVFKDQPSIDTEGYRVMPPMTDLLTREGYGAENNGNSGTVECQKFAQYYVGNYKTPHKVPVPVIKSVRPTDTRAAATWALLTRVDISDIIRLNVAAAGLTNAEFFVEGLTKEVRVLSPDYDYVEVTPNLSSVARYAFKPWP
jgi:hypothetical protein